MALQDLFAEVHAALSTTQSGSEQLRSWLQTATADCATRSESLEAFVPQELQQDVAAEARVLAEHFSKALPPLLTRKTRALWFGLFEQSSHEALRYVLTTYAGLSEATSHDSEEWWCGSELQQTTYFSLPVLTSAHRQPQGVSKDTSYAVYGLLPLVVLASVTKEVSKRDWSSNIDEYAFGWDGGDLVKWQRRVDT